MLYIIITRYILKNFQKNNMGKTSQRIDLSDILFTEINIKYNYVNIIYNCSMYI